MDQGPAGQQEDETLFLASLTHLANLYNWPLSALQNDEPYPVNISRSFAKATFLLHQQYPQRQLIIIEDDTHKATLVTVDEFTPEYDVAYIPIAPFYAELKRRANPARTALIESIMAYLYRVVRIPYYTDAESYMAWQLECITENYESEKEYSDDEEVCDEAMAEVAECKRYGEVCRRLINRPGVLNLLPHRSAQFRPKAGCEWDTNLTDVARQVMALLADHPTRRLDDASYPDLLEESTDNDMEEIRLDATVSFIWDTEGDIYENFSQSIDSDLQSGAQFERAKNVQVFDSPQPAITHSLDFEERLHTIIDVFCTCLYQIEKHEQRNEPVSADLPAEAGAGFLPASDRPDSVLH